MACTTTPKVNLIPAPQPFTKPPTHPLLFLSGSIPSNAATHPTWREILVSSLSSVPSPVTILNPHRADWDSNWRESLDFPPFVEQVHWELEGLEKADIVVVFFGGEAKAPISLLELGLCVGRGKKVVVCLEGGFWKGGNVRVLAERGGLEVVETVDELVERVQRLVGEWISEDEENEHLQ